jgi:hypothetical protein
VPLQDIGAFAFWSLSEFSNSYWRAHPLTCRSGLREPGTGEREISMKFISRPSIHAADMPVLPLESGGTPRDSSRHGLGSASILPATMILHAVRRLDTGKEFHRER